MSETCLIVGAGPGIGRSCALAFAAEGYNIALASRNPERLSQIASDVGKTTDQKARSYFADAAQTDSLYQLIEDVRHQQSLPSVLIFNVAATELGRPTTLPVKRLVDEFACNVGAALTLAQQLAPSMKQAGRGSLLFTGGGFALEPSADYSSLSLGKAALRNLTYSLAQELGSSGVHVATVTVYGFIQSGTQFDPGLIAQRFVELHRQPKGHFETEVIFK